jgi:hypothetical protein
MRGEKSMGNPPAELNLADILVPQFGTVGDELTHQFYALGIVDNG